MTNDAGATRRGSPRSSSTTVRKANGHAVADATLLRASATADLARSGLDADDFARLHVQVYTAAEAAQKLDIAPAVAGYVLPYFDLRGRPTKFFRYRFLSDTRSGFERLSGAKAQRYTQPANTAAGVYFPPYIDWVAYAAGDDPLLITEGEKKAARTTKAGLPCVGLGGVWSFQSVKHNAPLIAELKELNWKGRSVYVAFDSDAATNPQIRNAEGRLARQLTALGAEVYVVRLPPDKDGLKVGLDDFLEHYEAEALRRLCSQAELYAQSAALHEMNEEVLYIQDPGIIHVVRTGQIVTAADFTKHRFADRSYTRTIETPNGTKMETRPTATDWLKWPGRAVAARYVFEPGQPHVTLRNEYNRWRGWPYTPKRGSIEPWRRLLDYLFDGDAPSRAWFEAWAATPFQQPGVKQRNAVVLWGRMKGTGKSLVGFTLGDLYGEYYTQIGDEQLENHQFNDWAVDKQYVMGDDITGNNSRKYANALKVMVTREKLFINPKYVKPYTTRDCINYYFTSNDPDAFYLDEDDRRFFIHEVTHTVPLPQEFYLEYVHWRMSTEGRCALMYHLMNCVDVAACGYDPYAPPPLTAAKREMIELTRSDVEMWLMGVRDDPEPALRRLGGGDLITAAELMALYDPLNNHKITQNTFAKKMKIVGITQCKPRDSASGQIRIGDTLTRMYALRNARKWHNAPIAEVRSHYDIYRHQPKPTAKRKF